MGCLTVTLLYCFVQLPLVIQADPTGKPELFEVPLECAPPIHIHHPRYPGECAYYNFVVEITVVGNQILLYLSILLLDI